MKINDRILDGSIIQGELTEKTDGPSPGTAVPDPAPAELPQVRHPKTDSVELKTNSFFNFDQAAKLDPSKTEIGKNNDVPAAMIPGVPFREKVELPKTLPNGTSVDTPVASGDLGLGKKRTGPDHMGIDMKGTTMKNQLNDALKLKEGSQGASTSAPAGGTVNFNQIGGSHARDDKTYHAGLKRPGMDKISAEGDKKNTNPLNLPDYDKVKKDPPPDTSGASNLGKWIYDHSAGILTGKKWDETFGSGDDKKYTNPDAPEGTEPPVVTPETLHHLDARFGSNKRPSNEDLGQDTIDASKLSTADPRRKLVSNPNPEADSVTGNVGSIDVMHNANGPDTVNPNDPELGGGTEPIDPNRIK